MKMRDIRRLAKLMVWATTITMAILVASYLAVWLTPEFRNLALNEYLVGITNKNVSSTILFYGFVLTCGLLAILCYGLYQAVRFFRLYRTGDLFPPEAGGFLARLGIALICLGPATVVVRAISSVLFSLHLPPGQRMLAIGISGNDLLVIIIGGLIFMIGHLLNSASTIAEDNRHIV